jgi:alcohol dehydrogenase
MADRAVAQALVLEAPRRLVVRELALPNFGDDDALVRVAAGRCPFASLPRRCVGLDDAEDLLATRAGERDDVPAIHGVVLTP